MARYKKGHKNPGPGRPREVIKLEEVERLAALGCTYEEASYWLGVSLKTLKRRLSDDPKEGDQQVKDAWGRGLSRGNIQLRQWQFNMARNNPQMLIHLGKHRLGQKDITHVRHGGDPDAPPVKMEDVSAAHRVVHQFLDDAAERKRASGGGGGGEGKVDRAGPAKAATTGR